MRVFGVTGWKNSGKTGLMVRLLTEFRARHRTVSTLKHAHHSFDVDQEGTDSRRHREAGAYQVLLSSERRWALMTELGPLGEPTLEALLGKMTPVDLVLIEGWKHGRHPKIEAWRAETGQELIAPGDATIRAVAAKGDPGIRDRPVFDLDDTAAIADFITDEVDL